MSELFAEWYSKPVVIRRLNNTDPTSDRVLFDAPVVRKAQVEQTITLVRDPSGREVASTLQVFLPVRDAALVTSGSRIDIPGSQHPTTTVISVSVIDEGDELDGVAVMCE